MICARLLFFVAALACCGCENLTTRTAEYRPQEAGTVDQAMCLLGFTGIPLRAAPVTGHHLVDVELNGATGAFVLDTGANVSVVDQRYAAHFGLEPLGGLRGQAFGIGGGQEASLARIESLSIAGVTIRRDRMAIANIAQVAETLGRLTGAPVYGIIGQDVLTEHRAVIDVARPILYLIETDQDPAPVPVEACAETPAG